MTPSCRSAACTSRKSCCSSPTSPPPCPRARASRPAASAQATLMSVSGSNSARALLSALLPLLPLVSLGTAACEKAPPEVAPYHRPTPRPAAPGAGGQGNDKAAEQARCEGIAARPGAAWVPEVFPLRIGEGSAL